MGTNTTDVYMCQFERTEELNRKQYQRNLATQQMTQNILQDYKSQKNSYANNGFQKKQCNKRYIP